MSSARERAKAQRRGMASQRRWGQFATEPTVSRAEQAAQEALAGRTHTDWVRDQIPERAEAARRRTGEQPPVQVRTTWASVGAVRHGCRGEVQGQYTIDTPSTDWFWCGLHMTVPIGWEIFGRTPCRRAAQGGYQEIPGRGIRWYVNGRGIGAACSP